MYDEQHISGIIDFIYASSLVPLSNGRYGSFATGGCDGFVNVWDGTNKKRLCQVYRERERAGGEEEEEEDICVGVCVCVCVCFTTTFP